MKPGMSQSTQLRQELKINPRLYQAMDLLYMPLLDLQQHLKQELLNNPFLDLVEAEEEDVAARAGGMCERASPSVGACSTSGPLRMALSISFISMMSSVV